jgi:hypothetical protein
MKLCNQPLSTLPHIQLSPFAAHNKQSERPFQTVQNTSDILVSLHASPDVVLCCLTILH